MRKHVLYKWVSMTITILLIVLLVFVLIKSLHIGGKSNIFIFSDISECNNLVLYKHADAEIKRHSSADIESTWNYVDFFVATYHSESLNFKISAYEFSSIQDAKNYYCNVSKKDIANDVDFLKKSGMSGSLYLSVIDHTKVYHIKTNVSEYSELKALLEKSFSTSVTNQGTQS